MAMIFRTRTLAIFSQKPKCGKLALREPRGYFFHFSQNLYRPEFVFSVLLGPLRHSAHYAVHQRAEMFPDFVSHFHMAGVDQLCPQPDYLLLKLRGWRNLYEGATWITQFLLTQTFFNPDCNPKFLIRISAIRVKKLSVSKNFFLG